MALKISKQKEYEYTPLQFREDEKPFKVWFKPLTASELASLEDNLIELNPTSNSMVIRAGSHDLNVLRYSLLRWEGVEDEKGNPIKLDIVDGVVQDESLEQIPLSIRSEIAGVINNVSKDPDNSDLYLGTFTLEESKSATAKRRTSKK